MKKRILMTMGAVALLATAGAAAVPAPTRVQSVVRNNQKHLDARKAFTTPSDLTVLGRRSVAPGVEKRVVRDARGRIYCDIVRDGVVSKAPQVKTGTRRAPSATASFYEGFESWEGQKDWLPEGWTEINRPENVPTPWMTEININNTWYSDWTGDGYWTAITSDGEKECFIHFTYKGEYLDENGETVEFEAYPQDEWIISPQFTVAANQKLFFDLEVDLGNIYSFDWSTSVFDRTVIDHDVELLISTDNGENWTSVWKVSDDIASKMSDSELYDNIAELKYRTISVNIDEYAGKDIKLAFRYVNRGGGAMCGNSVAIDAITVDAPQAIAGYGLPFGSMLSEFALDLSVWDSSLALMPAHAELEWVNTSNQYCENYEWTFPGLEGGESTVVTDANPRLEYAYSDGEVYPYPTLKVSNDYSGSEFKFDGRDAKPGGIMYGGAIPAIDGNEVAVSNADYIHNSIVTSYISLGGNGRKTSYLFGTHEAGDWGEDIESVGVGNWFSKPASPFFVSGMMLTLGVFDADPDAEFTLTVYPIDDWGYEGDPIATATAKASDAYKYGEFTNLPFYFKNEDSDATQAPAGFNHDCNIVAIVSGYANNPKVREFGAASQYFDNADNSNYAYIRIRQPWGDDFYDAMFAASDVIEDYHNAVYLGMFGEFNFLKADKEEVKIDEDCKPAEITFTSLHPASEWRLTNYEGEGVLYLDEPRAIDWLTVTPSAADGVQKLTLTAAATSTERMMYLPLNAKGMSLYIKVVQDATSGVSVVAGDSLRVEANGDNVNVTNCEANATVSVYTLDGRLAGTSVADAAGNASVSVNAADNVLVVKAGKMTVKLMR